MRERERVREIFFFFFFLFFLLFFSTFLFSFPFFSLILHFPPPHPPMLFSHTFSFSSPYTVFFNHLILLLLRLQRFQAKSKQNIHKKTAKKKRTIISTSPSSESFSLYISPVTLSSPFILSLLLSPLSFFYPSLSLSLSLPSCFLSLLHYSRHSSPLHLQR